jgi:hypothetical protein
MAVPFNRRTEAVVKLVSPSTKFARREPASAFPTFLKGISEMIMLKIAAAVVGAVAAGALVVTFAPSFCSDVALAVIACFS